jgi:hypothetical protein
VISSAKTCAIGMLDVSCVCGRGNRPTLVLGVFGDFSEQLYEVGKVIAEEFGANDEILAGVEGR